MEPTPVDRLIAKLNRRHTRTKFKLAESGQWYSYYLCEDVHQYLKEAKSDEELAKRKRSYLYPLFFTLGTIWTCPKLFVLPLDGLAMIDKFDGEYSFLSNFYPSIIKMGGHQYQTAEHAYQASKSTNHEYRQQIRDCLTPGQAKRLGQRVVLRQDWELIKVTHMVQIVYHKFRHHRLIRIELINTGNQELIEGNTWGDTYWGVCRGVGQNKLGKILMDIRKELRDAN